MSAALVTIAQACAQFAVLLRLTDIAHPSIRSRMTSIAIHKHSRILHRIDICNITSAGILSLTWATYIRDVIASRLKLHISLAGVAFLPSLFTRLEL